MFSIRPSKVTRSLRTTLLWWLLPSAAVFMGVAWLIHGFLLEQMSRDFVHERLHQEAEFLERQVRQTYPDFDAALLADSYFDEVFHHTFALRIDDRVAFSHPRRQDQFQPWLQNPQTNFLTIEGDEAGASFLAFRKAFEMAGEPIVIIVAEDYSLLADSQQELHLWTAVVSAALLLFLVLLILLAVHIALRPVKQLQRELGDLRAGARDRLSLDVPNEFEGLIFELNRLLDTLDTRLERSRQGMANLSHSIKTPIAALTQILADRDTPVEGPLREQMVSCLVDLDSQLEAEMHRSSFAGPQAGKTAAPETQVREIVWMLGRLYENKQFHLETDLEQPRWPVEEHDFSELIGNLVDNAGKWAKYEVLVRLTQNQNELVIEVEDDGPGVEPSARAGLGSRGLRLDEQTEGHGLGLAIVRDIVERYNGHLVFSEGRLGGLLVRINLPKA